jgi:hypothetical protein
MSPVVEADDGKGYGVIGRSDRGIGVFGYSNISRGVHGSSHRYIGVYGYRYNSIGMYAHGGSGHAAHLAGNVTITGLLSKAGGSFKIDHPLDPANKYLYHSYVDSPDMKNVYDGIVTLDDSDEAEIDFPDWFGVLNKDFRYQLTAIGAPGPNLHIAEEISDTTADYSSSGRNNNNYSRFRISGGTPGMKVSWQVTDIRKDP